MPLATLEPITVSAEQQCRLTCLPCDPSEEVGAEDAQLCTICYAEDAQYALSTRCAGGHYYCAKCAKRTLESMLSAGQFPAQCPGCRADGSSRAKLR